jgi:putative salt-induced outer membrane protein
MARSSPLFFLLAAPLCASALPASAQEAPPPVVPIAPLLPPDAYLTPPLDPPPPVAPPRVVPTVPALPPAIRDMLQAAIASGNEADIATIARIARQTNPKAAEDISAMVSAYTQRKQDERTRYVRAAGFTQLWAGRGELGGFRSTGSTSEIGISASLSLQRTGLEWTHTIAASVDYRRANGQTSRERMVGSYQPKYQFNARGFVYGLAQYEHDPFLEFDARYTGSAGVGYKLIQERNMDLSLDVGPSLRYVRYTDGSAETALGAQIGRASCRERVS